MKVQTPKGETYRIGRRWLPWRRRVNSKAMGWLPTDGVSGLGLGDDPISLVLAAFLLIPLLLVLAFFIGEFLLLLLLPFFVLARSIFGTPWVIEVTHQREVVHAEEVKGWSTSQQRINDLVTAAGQGELPPGVEQGSDPRSVRLGTRTGTRVGTIPKKRLEPRSSTGLRGRPGRKRRLA